MTMNMMNETHYGNEGPSQREKGVWYVATKTLVDTPLENLDISMETGATVLSSRKGFWNESFNTYDIELFLWGTPDQLALAQEKYSLKSSEDWYLDQPEQYWG